MEMDRISEQNQRQNVSAIEGFAPHTNNTAAGTHDRQRDVFEMDSVRQYLRDLCDTGQAQNHISEIIESGIQPDCLRAELAFRALQGENEAVTIVINYLAGNFKEALQNTQQLTDVLNSEKMAEFTLFADYFAGRFDTGCNTARNLAAQNYSPFICYAYADMLLSLGYIDEARTYTKRYVMLAHKYLKNFVSEKEKFDDEKKRHEQSSRRRQDNNSGGGEKRQEEQDTQQSVQTAPRDVSQAQSPALYSALKGMLARRRVLLDVLQTRNVSVDKRPLMFELEDVDAQIANITGKFGGISRL